MASGEHCVSLIAGDTREEFHHIIAADLGVTALANAGFLDEAATLAQRCRQRVDSLPALVQSVADAVIGVAALRHGDLTTARRSLEPTALAHDMYATATGLAYRYGVYYTETVAKAGAVDAAATALRAVEADQHPAHEAIEYSYLLARAWVEAANGKISAARMRARSAAALCVERDQLAPEVCCLQEAALLGDPGGAARLAALATMVEGPRAVLAARHARALGSHDVAELASVSTQYERMGDLIAAAASAAQLAAAHRRARLRGSALTAAARAMRLARWSGAADGPVIAQARVTIPFSHREHEVATLIALGMTDRHIATTLGLSVRTVEEHARNARLKAGVSRRGDLADLMQGDGPPT